MTAFKNTWFGRLLTSIGAIFENAAGTFTDRVESLLKPLLPELEDLPAALISELGESALAAIKQAAAEGKRPRDWLDPAYDAIAARAAVIEIDLSSTLINFLATVFQGQAKAAAVADNTLVETLAKAEIGDQARSEA